MNYDIGLFDVTGARSVGTSVGSYDPKTHTVEAVITTFPPVQRSGFMELFDMSSFDVASAIGKPVLIEHENHVKSTVGKVVSAWRDGGSVAAKIQLLDTQAGNDVGKQLEAGLIKGVSIGYVGSLSDPHQIPTDPTDKLPNGRMNKGYPSKVSKTGRTMRNIRVLEVSFTQNPADPGAIIRSNEMSETQTTQTTQADPSVVEAERRTAIRSVMRQAGLPPEWGDQQIDAGADIVAVRSAAFDALAQRASKPIVTVTNPGVSPEMTRSAITEALTCRMNGATPSEQARPYMGQRLETIAAQRLEVAGVRSAGMTPDEVFKRSGIGGMATVSDFPALLSSAGNRVMMGAYTAASSPLKTQLARSTTLSDFRTGSKLKLSGLGKLAPVSEAGEIKAATRGEASESYALETFGRIFTMSRQALVNDDLGAFRDFSQAAGTAAAHTEADLLVNTLLSNPKLGEDGKVAFSTARGNQGVAAALSVAALSDARKDMRGFTALDGTLINSQAKYLLVGPELETAAEQLLASIYASAVDGVNPFSGRLTLLVEPRITDSRWYLFADPALVPVLEYAHLASAPGPQITQEDGFDVLGTRFRVYLDVGAGIIDWRGAYLNPGA
ncbi:Mu-like prophage major head subunit gpT family protein [Acetobacter sicerae]|uniref:Mu-like prophage major head subunit gpT family protein n=1 Tax=Acetobacter sicerae TaxID=85325 RepID=A0ABS8VUG1_9PROT|nr:prohead protease/major capsid protein fusion protein [Acetobacter sicerae]MCE0742903.1 Mu-like prophage major head subunit gpT family protein [Acetobacter sicerae]